MKDLHIIEQTYKEGGTIDGINLNVQIDYENARLSRINTCVFPKRLGGTELRVASSWMQFFYDDLSRQFLLFITGGNFANRIERIESVSSRTEIQNFRIL